MAKTRPKKGNVFRIICERPNLEIVGVNDLTDDVECVSNASCIPAPLHPCHTK